jgi:acyl-CoA thioester hydrolase
LGEKAMLEAEAKIRVRYAEVDQMGYVYYGNYAIYYEVARRAMMEKIGLSYVQFEKEGYFLPIAKLQVQYIKPALYDEEITVKIKLVRYSKVRLEFEYEVYNEAGEPINKGYTLQVFVDGKTRKPVSGPQYFIDLLDKYAGKEEKS